MAKRDNNYTRTKDRKDYKEPEDIDATLLFLEKNGKLPPKAKLPPRYISELCKNYYYQILLLDEKYEGNTSDEFYKFMKSDLQGRIINLSSIVIGSVIKRFDKLYPTYYQDVFTDCVVDILQAINRHRYNEYKSAFHSYIYETSYWACIKYIDKKATYENSVVSLLQV